MTEENQPTPDVQDPVAGTGKTPPSFPQQEIEIDLNAIFPDSETDLNILFPDVEIKRLLKKINRDKKDLHFMTERFTNDAGCEEESDPS